MQFNRVKYLLISIIVLISIVVVLFVLNSLNKKYPVSIEIAPKGNYYLKIDNVKYNYYDKSIYDLTAGNHTIEISRQDYDTRTEKINIKKDMATEIKIDMKNNLSGLKNINNIIGLSEEIKNKYRVDYVNYFDNNNLAVIVLVANDNNSNRLVMLASKSSGKWSVKIKPSQYIQDSELKNYPNDLRKYLRTFNNKAIENEE